jgi:hypothetical protein
MWFNMYLESIGPSILCDQLLESQQMSFPFPFLKKINIK